MYRKHLSKIVKNTKEIFSKIQSLAFQFVNLRTHFTMVGMSELI